MPTTPSAAFSTSPRPSEGGFPEQVDESCRAFCSQPRGEDWELKVLMKRSDSALQDPNFAYDLFNNMIAPLDKQALEGWTNRKLMEQEIIGSVQGLYRSLLIRNMTLQYAGKVNSMTKYQKELEGKLAKAEADREKEVRKAEAKLNEVSSERDSLKIQLKIAQEKTAFAEERLSATEKERKTFEDKAISLGSLLKITNNTLTSAEMKLASAEERASFSQRQMERAKEEAEEASRRAEEEKGRAEEEKRSAEAQVLKAVTSYKASEAFEDDVAAAGIGMFFTGFEDCKVMVAGAFPGLDLSQIQPPGPEEEGEQEEQPIRSDAEQLEIPAPPNYPEIVQDNEDAADV